MRINYLSQEGHSIIRQSEFKDSSGMPYRRCPCFNHKNERTFIVSSPIDYEFRVDEPIDKNFLHYNQEHLDTLVFHLTTPHFLLWTHDDNIWLEANDHPMTSLDNNLIMVPGWVHLSTWPSKASIGFVVVDKDKPVTIRKGDPLCRLSFHSSDLNDEVNLNKIEDRGIIDEIQEIYETKREEAMDNGTWKDRLFTKGKSKCPFARIIY
tara:strand:+ start:2774 stop:3397 length:624 start_codon:yes stop_codon:yes gene_type:complete